MLVNVNKVEPESLNSVQLTSLAKENKLLREKLQNQQKGATVILRDFKSSDDNETLSSRLDSIYAEPAENTPSEVTEITSEITEASFSIRWNNLLLQNKIVLFHEDVSIL